MPLGAGAVDAVGDDRMGRKVREGGGEGGEGEEGEEEEVGGGALWVWEVSGRVLRSDVSL